MLQQARTPQEKLDVVRSTGVWLRQVSDLPGAEAFDNRIRKVQEEIDRIEQAIITKQAGG